MGRVERVMDKVIVRLNDMHSVAPLKPGDGVVFDAAAWRSPDEAEEGGRLYGVRGLGQGLAELEFANRAIDLSRIHAGDLLWRSDDPEITKFAKTWTEATSPVFRRPIDVSVDAITGLPLRIEFGSVTVQSPEALAAAKNQGLTLEALEEQLSRLGNTPYRLGKLEANIEGNPFVPVSLLNQLRREAVEQLTASHEPKPLTVYPVSLDRPLIQGQRAEAQLHLLVRQPRQLDAALELAPASITLDYLDLYGLKPSVDRVRKVGIEVRVATPRVLKPGEEGIAEFLKRLGCPLLVRAAGLLDTLEGNHTADFSLNVANALTAQLVLDMGVARITPGHDLNGAQILDLAHAVDPAKLEVVAYQHLPVFHTEHCVFCRFMSSGTSYKDCGRPCEEHELALEDKQGRRHAVIADVGCRNTIFGAEAQEATAFLKSWQDAGIHHFRLEFVHEDADEVREITRIFQDALAGHPGEAATRLRRMGATTQGSLYVAKGYKELPILQ